MNKFSEKFEKITRLVLQVFKLAENTPGCEKLENLCLWSLGYWNLTITVLMVTLGNLQNTPLEFSDLHNWFLCFCLDQMDPFISNLINQFQIHITSPPNPIIHPLVQIYPQDQSHIKAHPPPNLRLIINVYHLGKTKRPHFSSSTSHVLSREEKPTPSPPLLYPANTPPPTRHITSKATPISKTPHILTGYPPPCHPSVYKNGRQSD